MLDRRRARSTSRRMLPDEGRRVSSFWMPAFMAAVAANDCGKDAAAIVREAAGDWLRDVSLGGEGEASGDGGSELMSGGIAVVWGWLLKQVGVGMRCPGGVRCRVGSREHAGQWSHSERARELAGCTRCEWGGT
jgi:hypothetical protein